MQTGVIHLAYTRRRQSMRHIVFNEELVRTGCRRLSDLQPVPIEFRRGALAQPSACQYVNTPP